MHAHARSDAGAQFTFAQRAYYQSTFGKGEQLASKQKNARLKALVWVVPVHPPPQTGPISFPLNLKPPIPHLNARYLMLYLTH